MVNSGLIKTVVESLNDYPGQTHYTYIPIATYDSKGIASFSSSYFTISSGHVMLKASFINNLKDELKGYTDYVAQNFVEVEDLVTHSEVSASIEANKIVKRLSSANIKVPDIPLTSTDATSKYYVDQKAAAILASVQDVLVFDNVPTPGSNNLLHSGTVYNALSTKADLVDGKVPTSQLPSYVDDVLEYNSMSDFPVPGEDSKIYVAKDTNLTYRWGGSGYVNLSSPLALGETSSTAYPGNKGKQNADAIAVLQTNFNNIPFGSGTGTDSAVLKTPTPSFDPDSGTPIIRTNTAPGDYSVSIGSRNQAIGKECLAAGGNAIAGRATNDPLGEANDCVALGYRAEATGENAAAIGGYRAKAKGANSFANGNTVTANGDGSNSFGSQNTSDGDFSSTRGKYTHTEYTAMYGEASGFGTNVRNVAEHAVGKYNDDDVNNTDRLFSVGNGTGGANRHSAFEVGGDIGEEYIKVGDVTIPVDTLRDLVNEFDGRKLDFTSNGDGTCYVSGLGTYTGSDVYIPVVSPLGEKVTSIGYGGAYYEGVPYGLEGSSIVSIHIPKSVVKIPEWAFGNTPNLQEIYTYYDESITATISGLIHNCDVFNFGTISMQLFRTSISTQDEPIYRLYNKKVVIKTESELRNMANSEDNSPYTLFVLNNDIDVSGSGWSSIGTASKPFVAGFSGRGNRITGIRCSYNRFTGDGGLFGVVKPTSYMNVGAGQFGMRIGDFTLTSSGNGLTSAYGGYNLGTVVCVAMPDTYSADHNSWLTIENVHSAVTVDTSAALMQGCGGILGTISSTTSQAEDNGNGAYISVTINRCRFSGSLGSPSAGSICYGGIVGWTNAVRSNRHLTIANCLVDGEIHIWGQGGLNKYDDNGGIIGYIKGNGGVSRRHVYVDMASNIFAGKMLWRRDSGQTGGTADQGFILGEITTGNYLGNVSMGDNYYVVTTPEGGLNVTAGIGTGESYASLYYSTRSSEKVMEKTLSQLEEQTNESQNLFVSGSSWDFGASVDLPVPVGVSQQQ